MFEPDDAPACGSARRFGAPPLAPLAGAQQGDVSAAASAFSRAQEAEARGDPSRAASLYELADRISPAPAALRNATRARLAAGQLAAAAVNAEELKRRYPGDADSMRAGRRGPARSPPEARARLGAVQPGLPLWWSTGSPRAPSSNALTSSTWSPVSTRVVARFESGASATQNADAKAGQADSAPVDRTRRSGSAGGDSAGRGKLRSDRAGDAAARDGSGACRGLVAGRRARDRRARRVVLGGVAVWSAIDTQNASDDFKKNPTREAFDDGEGKDTRTSILIGAAAVVGVASASVLLFATDWSGGKAQSGQMSLRFVGSPRQTGFNLQGSF